MTHRHRFRLLATAALLLLAACEQEGPAVQDSAIDEGGLYEDGSLEQVQPVEPEVVPEPDSATIPAAG